MNMENSLNLNSEITKAFMRTPVKDTGMQELLFLHRANYLGLKRLLAMRWKKAQPCPNKHMIPHQHECRFTIEQQLKTLDEIWNTEKGRDSLLVY